MDPRQATCRVLLVDDEPEQVEMYTLGLTTAGFDVRPAYTGADCLAAALTERPDVIVLDLRLPDLSGLDVCARLKGDPGTARIPIILITAAASPSLPMQARAAGCAAFLLKPCFPDDLAGTIRQILASHTQA